MRIAAREDGEARRHFRLPLDRGRARDGTLGVFELKVFETQQVVGVGQEKRHQYALEDVAVRGASEGPAGDDAARVTPRERVDLLALLVDCEQGWLAQRIHVAIAVECA